MPYLATWAVFVQDEGLDAINAAKVAHGLAQNPDHATWKITDLDTGQVFLVDLKKERVIKCLDTIQPK